MISEPYQIWWTNASLNTGNAFSSQDGPFLFNDICVYNNMRQEKVRVTQNKQTRSPPYVNKFPTNKLSKIFSLPNQSGTSLPVLEEVSTSGSKLPVFHATTSWLPSSFSEMKSAKRGNKKQKSCPMCPLWEWSQGHQGMGTVSLATTEKQAHRRQ